MLKVELHAHTADDPVDRIPHTTRDLVDRAARLGYHALAVTLHERQLDVGPHAAYAAERGITLIPGIERTIEGKHVLLLNFSRDSERVETFDDLAHLRRREHGLVVAPHPFFPIGSSLGLLLHRYAHLFDAVERNAMHTGTLDFNRRAERWARTHGKPVVGNGDVHRLVQLGRTYSLVDAAPEPAAVCDAIRLGRVEVRSTPLSWWTASTTLARMTLSGGLPRRSRRAPVPGAATG